MSRLRDIRPQRANGALDWVFLVLSLAALLVTVGIGYLVSMISHRESWEGDSTMPAVFVMFARVINSSTIGVLCIFIGVVIATAAVLLWFIREKNERVLASQERLWAQQERIFNLILTGRATIKPRPVAAPVLVPFDTGGYPIVRQERHGLDIADEYLERRARSIRREASAYVQEARERLRRRRRREV